LAIVKSFSPGHQSVRVHHTEVPCYFQVVNADDGTIYLHLSTFGSDDRAVPGKSSQSLQLDATSAHALAEIIEATFGARSA